MLAAETEGGWARRASALSSLALEVWGKDLSSSWRSIALCSEMMRSCLAIARG